MQEQFGLIYFIHDDLRQGMMTTLTDRLLRVPEASSVKMLFVHNIRKITKKGKKRKIVSYVTYVKEIIKFRGRPRFVIRKKAGSWQDGLSLALKQMKDWGIAENIGLIVLSHAEGFVLKGPEPYLEKILMQNDFAILGRQQPRQRKSKDSRYKVNRYGKTDYLIQTLTVLEPDPHNNAMVRRGFSRPLTSGAGEFYCKKYEGLFTFQLASFLDDKKARFGFIGFSSCNGQIIDNAFLFTGCSRFTIGAESYSDVGFLDFPLIVQSLENKTGTSIDEICRSLFTACSDNFRADQPNQGYYYLVELDNLKWIAPGFDLLLDRLIALLKADKSVSKRILEWIKNERVASGDPMVPFYDLCRFFFGIFPSDKQVAQFMAALKEKLIVADSPPDDPLQEQFGYSIFLPRNKAEFLNNDKGVCNYLDAGNKNPFLENTKYNEFLSALYGV